MKQLTGILLLCLFSLLGCTPRNRGDCTIQQIRFHYYGDGSSDIFQEKVQHLNLLVYDVEHRLIQQRFIGPQQIAQSNTFPLNLPHGAFQLIAIANNQTEFTSIYVAGKQASLNDLAVHTRTLQPLIAPNQSPLYLGGTEVDNYKDKIQLIEVELKNQTHFKLKVELVGIDKLALSPDQLQLSIQNIPANLQLKEFKKSDCITIRPSLQTRSESQLETAVLSLFRPQHLDKTWIEVSSGQQLLKRISLDKVLELNPSLSWHLQELTLRVRFTFEHLDVSVSLPEWDMESLEPNFN